MQGQSEINILSHKYLLSVSSTLGTLPGVFISQLNSGQPCFHVPEERPRQVANDLQSPTVEEPVASLPCAPNRLASGWVKGPVNSR